MTSDQITSLTTAFDLSTLVTAFIGLAPFILGGLTIVIGIALVRWVVRKVTGKLSKGV